MQTCRYLPVKENCFSALLGHYTTFGLRAETETGRGWVPLLTLSDVSCDEELSARSRSAARSAVCRPFMMQN